MQQYARKIQRPPSVQAHPVLTDVVVLVQEDRDENARIAPTGREVIVGSLCGCAVLRGADVFAPGVLGAPHALAVGDAVAVFADVEDKCLRGFAKEFAGKKVFVGNGKALMGRDDLFKTDKPKGVAIEMSDTVSGCPSLNELEQTGHFMLQNLPSIVASHALNPNEGETVLDLCAAPGGKTTHLASMVGAKGQILAFDRSAPKIEQIKRNAEILGLTNVFPFVGDSRKQLCCVQNGNDPSTRGCNPPYLPESFPRILLDAPCSALGQRPQFRNSMKLKELSSFPKLQRQIFSTAVKLLKRGGVLVYSTCTFAKAENEDMVLWALKEYPNLSLEETLPKIGSCGLFSKSSENEIESHSPNSLTRSQAEMVQRFSKSEDPLSDSIGFFIAKFKKED